MRVPPAFVAAVLAGLLGGTAPGPAFAADNVSPSTATSVESGIPFTGVWGTPFWVVQWWRVAPVMHAGDRIQLAIDNSSSIRETLLCLAAPVDDFDASETTSRCGFRVGTGIPRGGRQRRTLGYSGATGQPFLILAGEGVDTNPAPQTGQYVITIERVTTLINVGVLAPRSVHRSFRYMDTLRYGDNTSVDDGLTAQLQWRRAPGAPGPASFTTLKTTTSVSGRAVFRAQLPRRARRVVLRVCVNEPGGARKCTPGSVISVRR